MYLIQLCNVHIILTALIWTQMSMQNSYSEIVIMIYIQLHPKYIKLVKVLKLEIEGQFQKSYP